MMRLLHLAAFLSLLMYPTTSEDDIIILRPTPCVGWESNREDYNAALLAWTNPPCYDFTYRFQGFGRHAPDFVQVRDGLATGENQRTINDFYSMIAEFCINGCPVEGAQTCRIQYEEGIPTQILIDISPYTADEERAYILSDFALCSEEANIQAAPIEPPVSPPKSLPTVFPVNQPTSAPDMTPVDPSVVPPVEPPVSPPVPDQPPTASPVVAPTSQPIEPPISPPVDPPVESPMAPPVEAPIEQPMLPPEEPPRDNPPPIDDTIEEQGQPEEPVQTRTVCQDWQATRDTLMQARADFEEPSCYDFGYTFDDTPYQVRVRDGVSTRRDLGQFLELIQQDCLANCPDQGPMGCNVELDETGAPRRIEILEDENHGHVYAIESLVECEEDTRETTSGVGWSMLTTLSMMISLL